MPDVLIKHQRFIHFVHLIINQLMNLFFGGVLCFQLFAYIFHIGINFRRNLYFTCAFSLFSVDKAFGNEGLLPSNVSISSGYIFLPFLVTITFFFCRLYIQIYHRPYNPDPRYGTIHQRLLLLWLFIFIISNHYIWTFCNNPPTPSSLDCLFLSACSAAEGRLNCFYSRSSGSAR